jgi:hypothetical protein
VPQGQLDAVSRHGFDVVDSGTLYALGALLAGALWLIVLVCDVRADRDERMLDAWSERPGQKTVPR